MPNIFNSLGSNYSFAQAISHLFMVGTRNDYRKLKNRLSERYDGTAFLFYKGREALRQAFWASDLKRGSYVAINGFTCYAVDEAVTEAGFNPVYVDIDPEQLHFSASNLEKAIKDNPEMKAVIIQNTLGYSCDIVEIEALCQKHNLLLIEDLAHSFGLVYPDGREAGSVGDMVMLSFGRDKVIDAVAGGALIIRGEVSPEWKSDLYANRRKPSLWDRHVDRLYPLHTWLVRAFFPVRIGKLFQIFFRQFGFLPRATDGIFNGATDLPYQNAKEVNKLIDGFNDSRTHRNEIADIYRREISLDFIPKVAEEHDGKPIELRFPVKVQNRDTLLNKLKQNGINISDIWYDCPIAPPRFMKMTAYKGQCEFSELTTSQLINLPTHRNISVDQARKLAERISQHVSND